MGGMGAQGFSIAEKLRELGQPTACPECSGEWCSLIREMGQSFKSAANPKDAPLAAMGVLPEHRAKTTIVSWDVTLECENGHTLEFEQFVDPAGRL